MRARKQGYGTFNIPRKKNLSLEFYIIVFLMNEDKIQTFLRPRKQGLPLTDPQYSKF